MTEHPRDLCRAPVSRRTFALGAAAVAALLGAGGCGPLEGLLGTDAPESDRDEDDGVRPCDVLVVGAGGAGMCAAIAAHDAGASVVVLEKTATTGGNACFATSGVNASQSVLQQEQGVQDSNESYVNDTLEGGHNLASRELVEHLCANAAGAVEWLGGLGVDLPQLATVGGMSAPRAHRPADGVPVGNVLVPALEKAMADRGIAVLAGTQALGLFVDDQGTCSAVRATDPSLGEVFYQPRAVVLATGGLCSSASMVEKYRPDLQGAVSTNQPASAGDGYRMAESAGAQLVQMEQIQVHPTATLASMPDGRPCQMVPDALREGGAVLVNSRSERFFDETAPHDYLSTAILGQPGCKALLVFDDAVRDANPFVASDLEPYGLVYHAADASDLAQQTKLDPAAFARTIDEYNASVLQGDDDAFGRTKGRVALQGALHGVIVGVGAHYEMGGVRIDAQARALTSQGDPILGLYAAGEVTGGVHGANRLGGNGITDAIVFGRTAGEQAAAWASAAHAAGRRLAAAAKELSLPQ